MQPKSFAASFQPLKSIWPLFKAFVGGPDPASNYERYLRSWLQTIFSFVPSLPPTGTRTATGSAYADSPLIPSHSDAAGAVSQDKTD